MDQPIKNFQKAPSIGPAQAAKPRSGRRFVLTSIVILLIVGGVVWWTKHSAPPKQANGGRNSAPMSIVPEVVGKGDIGININALGTVTSLATVTIRTQISGYMQKIDFTEGNDVKKGDLLAEIDPRPYEATLAQAKGTIWRATRPCSRARRSTWRDTRGLRRRTPCRIRRWIRKSLSSPRIRARSRRTRRR